MCVWGCVWVCQGAWRKRNSTFLFLSSIHSNNAKSFDDGSQVCFFRISESNEGRKFAAPYKYISSTCLSMPCRYTHIYMCVGWCCFRYLSFSVSEFVSIDTILFGVLLFAALAYCFYHNRNTRAATGNAVYVHKTGKAAEKVLALMNWGCLCTTNVFFTSFTHLHRTVESKHQLPDAGPTMRLSHRCICADICRSTYFFSRCFRLFNRHQFALDSEITQNFSNQTQMRCF